MQANLSFLQAEEATALNCSKAWESLRKFESFYPNMVFGAKLDGQYSNNRAQCLVLSKQTAEALGLKEGIALDAILLLDRLMHQSQEAFSEVRQLRHPCLFLLCTHQVQCLLICLRYIICSYRQQNATNQTAVWPLFSPTMSRQKHNWPTDFTLILTQCLERHRHACMQHSCPIIIKPPACNHHGCC